MLKDHIQITRAWIFFSFLFYGKYFIKSNAKKGCNSCKSKLGGGGGGGQWIQTLLLWLWELLLFPSPVCADKKVKTSRNGKCESVVSGREATWRHIPHLVWRRFPIVCPFHSSSLLQLLIFQDRKSIRGQEMVRTELDFNLLSPFFNNAWCC